MDASGVRANMSEPWAVKTVTAVVENVVSGRADNAAAVMAIVASFSQLPTVLQRGVGVSLLLLAAKC